MRCSRQQPGQAIHDGACRVPPPTVRHRCHQLVRWLSQPCHKRRRPSRQRSSSAFRAPPAPSIGPRSSAWACSNVQRRSARRLFPLSAVLVSTSAGACRAGRIPVSIMSFPLRVNGADAGYCGYTQPLRHAARAGCDAGIRGGGKCEAAALRRPEYSNPGAGEPACRRTNYRQRVTGAAAVCSRRPLGGRFRRAALRHAKAGAPQPGNGPGRKERASCQSLTGGRSEAAHCPAPVAGKHQLRPRSHVHRHAVHPFIARSPTLGQRTVSAGK